MQFHNRNFRPRFISHCLFESCICIHDLEISILGVLVCAGACTRVDGHACMRGGQRSLGIVHQELFTLLFETGSPTGPWAC